jgi:hypothetical protein
MSPHATTRPSGEQGEPSDPTPSPPTVSHVHGGCQQQSGSVNTVDDTVAPGAKRPARRHDPNRRRRVAVAADGHRDPSGRTRCYPSCPEAAASRAPKAVVGVLLVRECSSDERRVSAPGVLSGRTLAAAKASGIFAAGTPLVSALRRLLAPLRFAVQSA